MLCWPNLLLSETSHVGILQALALGLLQDVIRCQAGLHTGLLQVLKLDFLQHSVHSSSNTLLIMCWPSPLPCETAHVGFLQAITLDLLQHSVHNSSITAKALSGRSRCPPATYGTKFKHN
eukprot:1157922-Pelagomonas_calceolata.AAC.18